MDTLAEQMLVILVSVGEPTNISIYIDNGRVLKYATVIGLILNGLQGLIAREDLPCSLVATFKRALGRIWKEMCLSVNYS